MSLSDELKISIEQEAYGFWEQKNGVTLERDGDGYIKPVGHNDALDAFRHAYTSGRVTNLAFDTQFVAEHFGNEHELGTAHRNLPLEHRMDLWNNEVGRRAGEASWSKEVLAETLFEHMDNGMLVAALADERLSLLYGEDPKLLDPLNPASQVLTDAESEADVT
ncbi:MAG: hypothetical protein MUQ62_06325 [Reinekea forsetii]|nr:hypothetical protein [Reinekea forsetii]